MPGRDPAALRSHRWFGRDDLRGFAHRQRLQQIGFAREQFLCKPVIGILNAWSGLSPCHAHLRARAETAAQGVLAAGGFPVELPVLSLGEVMVKPTTMLYRNLLALEAEELIRSHPLDAVLLLGGCDKTGPGLVMGAISADCPCIFVPAGPMMNAKWRGETVGAGTHTRKFWDEYRAGRLSNAEWVALEAGMTRGIGTCNTMGTASTMTLAIEALGLSLPGAAAIPAADAEHVRMVTRSAQRIVEMAWEDLRPSRILSAASFLNAAAAVLACGGSTNAPIHLIAMARRAQLPLALDDFDRLAASIPVLVNLMPAGSHLMQDFFDAGGLPALLAQLGDAIDGSCATVAGAQLSAGLVGAKILDDEVIRPCARPVSERPAFVVLHGNLAPGGALLKPTAADPRLLQHRGAALVFDGPADLAVRIDAPELPVTPESVIVLRGGGPIGGPGMPEWGNLPIPKKLLAQGVRDMLRVSDARMSGTHYGACVLHCAPEAAVGGPLALVCDGDEIELDYARRTLTLHVTDDELARRRAAWKAPAPYAQRGYAALYARHVTQAPEGCDFDFLDGRGGVPEPAIY
ncbi:MAG: dihydroxy-acid dehydratase [Betaproteobacteria bacterium]|nr:dihydroxy-acid dehydratase [Betaproteobacteria bacterium]